MAQNKKDFTADVAGVFVDKMITPTPANTSTPKAKAAKKQPRPETTGAEEKATFMLYADVAYKLRYICFAQRTKQKTIINDALRAYIEDYEARNGKIK